MQPIDVVHDILTRGTLAQFASIADAGPRVFHAWYAFEHETTSIILTTGRHTHHVQEWEHSGKAGGTIFAMTPEGVGQPAEAVSFFGMPRMLTGHDLDRSYETYAQKWPRIRTMIPLVAVQDDHARMPFFAIDVTEWVLYSQIHSTGEDRLSIPVKRTPR